MSLLGNVTIEEKKLCTDAQPHPPLSPQAPQNPPVNLPGVIRNYLKVRKIWQTSEGRFALNDDVSKQVRKDTIRFRIDEKYWLGL